VGDARLLTAGVFTALVGMAWLSRISATTGYFPRIALPMLLLGLGIGTALTPLTTAGVAGVDPKDAGAASGVVNVAQQLGGSLGLGILITVFAAASRAAGRHPVGATVRLQSEHQLAHAVATSLRGSAVFLALGFGVVALVMRRPRRRADQEMVSSQSPSEAGATLPAPAPASTMFPPTRVWAPRMQERRVVEASDAVDVLAHWPTVNDERKCS
jgi:hypothetical protein